MLFDRCARRATQGIVAAADGVGFNAQRPYAIMRVGPACRDGRRAARAIRNEVRPEALIAAEE